MGTVLEVKNVSAAYQEGKGEKTVLKGISFEVRENEILGLVGESGCGKSTCQSDPGVCEGFPGGGSCIIRKCPR